MRILPDTISLHTDILDALKRLIRNAASDVEIVVSENRSTLVDEQIGLYIENGKLYGLSLRYCGFESLPDLFGQLTDLRQLDITGNQLTALPDSFDHLVNLESLYADHNLLDRLPDTFGQLTSLRELHLDNNQLAALPKTIGNLA